ncbi:MAG: hypothetical protein ACYDIC_17155 [Desulfobaccales bacterium]
MVMGDTQLVKILENYNNYAPPAWVKKTVVRLINGVPDKYFNSLKIISLCNTDGLNHRRRRQKTISRKKKVAIPDCQGLYYQKWHGHPAYIELFVDKIIQGWPAIVISFPFFKDLVFSEVLYHELGHHIHKTSQPEHKEREDVAEVWKRRLSRLYFQDRYFYSKMFFYPLLVFWMPFAKLKRLIEQFLKRLFNRSHRQL